MILILVQACDIPPYDALMAAQKDTWDKIEHPETKTIYYISSDKTEKTHFKDNVLYTKCPSGYPMLHWSMKIACDEIWDMEWDYVFRTNASSYIDKTLLVEFAKTLPKEGCYCGIDGGSYASGAGVFMSRDVIKILKDKLDDSPSDFEDAYMGIILGRNGVKLTPGARRVIVDHTNYSNIPHCYHYRCKSDNGDRTKDINAFYAIYGQNKIH